jgi:GT2 family glycosyltransferase
MSDPGGDAIDLSISIVVFRPDMQLLRRTSISMKEAVERLRARVSATEPRLELTIVDNEHTEGLDDLGNALREAGIGFSVLRGHGNVGFGRGHDLAISRASSRFHLVLNPDVEFHPDALAAGIAFLEARPDVGLLTPLIVGSDGAQQYLCRRYPALLDLLVRGFLPTRLRACFSRRLVRYEMRDVVNDHDVVWDPPIVSGCFMLFRTDVLKQLGGFDPRYFLYFEDYDLSLRTHDVAHVAYVPSVRIVHHGGGAARKGWMHIKLFAASAFKFYNRFGWKWL